MAMTALARVLLIAAILLIGFLAGGDLDRTLVAMPAWQHVGSAAWATFSRHADLANGLLLYPFEAIGGTLLILGAILGLHAGRIERRAALFLLYAALALSIGGLLFTVKAAPIMLGIRHLNDPAALQQAFDRFLFWGNARSICQIAAFVSLACALATLRTVPGERVATHIKQEETELAQAFLALDSTKIHFAILGHWEPGGRILVRSEHDREYLARIFGIVENDAFTFRRPKGA